MNQNIIDEIDQFLTDHSERGAFSEREITDFLLDLRFLAASNGGAFNEQFSEGLGSELRTNPDPSELAYGQEAIATSAN